MKSGVGLQAVPRGPTLAIDLGKTACRVRVGVDEREAVGTAGLAERDGETRAIAAVERVLNDFPTAALESVGAVGIGAAGFEANPDAAAGFARYVAQRIRAPTTITSDVVTAHVGALGGEPGTVLVAGTGSVAWNITTDSLVRRADGWGIWLGDDGSGRWIGRAGLAAALRAADGRGAATTLLQAATELAGSIDRLPKLIGGNAAPERRLAAFAPTVFAHAEAGDSVALSVFDEAIRHLAVTAAAVTVRGDTIAVLGGLLHNAAFAEQLGSALADLGLQQVRPIGDALEGAAMIALRTDLPHERRLLRV